MSSPSARQFVAEATALGMNLNTPIDDITLTTPIEVLRGELEFLLIAAEAVILPQARRPSLEQLEAASSYLTSAPEDNECAICFTELVATDNEAEGNLKSNHHISTAINLNTCGHNFHSGCLLDWMEHSNTCPFCRRKILKGQSPVCWRNQEIS